MRSMVLAATVMSHGAMLLTVPGVGPALPAEQAVTIPFWLAWNVPRAMLSRYNGGKGGSLPNEIDTMSTPSCTAASMAARMSASVHPPPLAAVAGQHTLYSAIRACGAPPFAVPLA